MDLKIVFLGLGLISCVQSSQHKIVSDVISEFFDCQAGLTTAIGTYWVSLTRQMNGPCGSGFTSRI